MRKLALLLVVLSAIAACKDGVTPDCTTDPTVCSPDQGGDSTDSGTSTVDATPAPVDASSDAIADADAGD